MLLTLDDSHPRTGNADIERRLLFFSVESDTARNVRMTSLKSSLSGAGARAGTPRTTSLSNRIVG